MWRLLLILVLMTSPILLDETADLPPIEISKYGLETYLLFEQFGSDVTSWTQEQIQTADSFLTCIDTLKEASINPPEFRLILRCWDYTN